MNSNYRSSNIFLITSVLITVVHVICACFSVVPFICVFFAPVFILIFNLIMSMSLSASEKTNDFTMIAGYKETYSIEGFKKKMYMLKYFYGIGSVLMELLFFTVYFNERKMMLSIMIFIVYISYIIMINIVAGIKYAKQL